MPAWLFSSLQPRRQAWLCPSHHPRLQKRLSRAVVASQRSSNRLLSSSSSSASVLWLPFEVMGSNCITSAFVPRPDPGKSHGPWTSCACHLLARFSSTEQGSGRDAGGKMLGVGCLGCCVHPLSPPASCLWDGRRWQARRDPDLMERRRASPGDEPNLHQQARSFAFMPPRFGHPLFPSVQQGCGRLSCCGNSEPCPSCAVPG